MSGSIRVGGVGGGYVRVEYGRRMRAMGAVLGFPDCGGIPAWNDAPARTWQEVKDLVKDAVGRL